MNKITIKAGYILIQAIVLVFFLLILLPQSASAAYSDMPGTPANPLPDAPGQLINLVSYPDIVNDTGGGANLKRSTLRVYAQSPQNVTIQLNLVNKPIVNPGTNQCSGFAIEATRHADDLPLKPSVTTSAPITGCTGSNDYQFTITSDWFRLSDEKGHEGIYEMYVTLRLATSGNTTATFKAFVSSTSGGVTNARLGFAENRESNAYPYDVYQPYTGGDRYVSLYPNNPGEHNVAVRFKPNCEIFANTNFADTFVFWDDDDAGTAFDFNVTAGIYKYPENSTSPMGTGGIFVQEIDLNNFSWRTGLWGWSYYKPSGEPKRVKLTMEKGFKYEVRFRNVNGPGNGQSGNGIAIWPPFQSGNWDLPCPPPDPSTNTASCSLSISGPGVLGPNQVQAGQQFTVTVNTRNNSATTINSTMTDATGVHPLAEALFLNGSEWQPPSPDNTSFFGLGRLNLNTSIAPGATVSHSFTQIAPNDMDRHTLNMIPGYWMGGPLGVPCSITIDTYQQFHYDAVPNPTTNLNNVESPSVATHTATMTKRAGSVDITGTITRNYYKNSTATPPLQTITDSVAIPNSSPYVFSAPPYNVPINSYAVGDLYCVSIHLDYGHGWRGGPGGSLILPGYTPEYADNCGPGESPPVKNIPYVRAYGSDVVAGGGFGAACAATDSKILAYISPLNDQASFNRSGSGVQLAAMALREISGFMSASTRTADPNAPKDLTFGHDTSIPDPLLANPIFGGNMATGNGWCMPDYFQSTQFTDSSMITKETSVTPAFNVMGGTLQRGKQTIKNVGGATVTVQSSGVANYTNRYTLYVDGNAYIDRSIMYSQTAAAYATIDAIPSFTLVVRGNIYIDPTVEQLDGLYIAQSFDRNSDGDIADAGEQGRIYTCASSGGPVPSGNAMFNLCGANDGAPSRCAATPAAARRLTVNGAFLAERVVLNRTGYSMGCSVGKELAGASKASEVFNFSPEMYLSPPVFRPTGTPTSGEFKSIAILAPFL